MLHGIFYNYTAKLIHEGFIEVLKQIQIDSDIVPLIKKQLTFSLKALDKSIAENKSDTEAKVKEIKQRIEKLEERFILGEIDRTLFDKYKQKFTEEMSGILPETTQTQINLSNPEKLAEKCIQLSQNISKIWVNGDKDEKSLLQKLVFRDRIYYNTQKSTYRTVKINSVFSQMAQLASNLKGSETKNPPSFSGDSHQVARTRQKGMLSIAAYFSPFHLNS